LPLPLPSCVRRKRQAASRPPVEPLTNPPSAWMAYFLQQLINGLTLGSIYGLIAI
jgi:hypothetical protein